MKKVLTIGLMLLVCAGFVFAANATDTLKVSLEIDGKTEIRWVTTEGNNLVDDASDWTSATDIETINDKTDGFEIGNDYSVLIAVNSNNPSLSKLTITGSALSSEEKADSNSHKIKLTVSDGNSKSGLNTESNSVDYDGTSDDSKSIVYTLSEQLTERLYASAVINLKVDSETYNAAPADTYVATLTVTADAE